MTWSGQLRLRRGAKTIATGVTEPSPSAGGRVSLPAALTTAIVLLVAGELLLLLLEGWRPALAGLGLIGLIVLYDAWHKGNPLSPVLMGACRAMVYFVAAFAVAGGVPTEVGAAAAVLLVYIVGLTQVAKAEGGSLLSWWPLAAVLAAVGYWVGWVDSVWFALLLVAFAAWIVRSLWLVRRAHRIGAGVVSLIAGVALYDALAVASVGGSLAAVGVCLAAFLVTIALQTKIAGT